MPRPSNRAGFTLVELLIVAVIGMVLLGSMYQIMVSSQRTYTVQQVRIQNQQVMRSGLELLASEIREASTRDAFNPGLLTLAADGLELQSMLAFGRVCLVLNAASTDLMVRLSGPAFEAGDAVVVFGEGDPDIRTDDRHYDTTVQLVNPEIPDGCLAGVPGQSIVLAGGWPNQAVRAGAPVRAHTSFEYGLIDFGGDIYLGRTEGGGAAQPVVGPLAADDGLLFEYFDIQGNVTAIPTQVAEIRLTLRTLSQLRDTAGDLVGDDLTTRIFLRN
ncbi:MAG: prepilin-type N-terminal cleavage/methylation domain-containing protein [Gemmatimonadota bacterium]